LGTVTGLFVLLHACGGDDRDFGSEETGGAGGANAGTGGGKATGGGGGAKATGGSGGKATGGNGPTTGGSDAGGGGNDAGGNGPTAGTDSGGMNPGGAGAGGVGGENNEGGAGGEPVVVVDPGRPGSALVTGGNVMSSAKYRLVLTTGEGPGGTQVLKSQNYTLIGGLIGTTEQ
jgi:hypothetical protein